MANLHFVAAITTLGSRVPICREQVPWNHSCSGVRRRRGVPQANKRPKKRFMNSVNGSEVAIAVPASSADRAWLWLVPALAAMITLLYSGIFILLAEDWWSDPNFSHGFFVPAFSAFIIWKKRKELANLTTRPSWSGLGVVLVALLVYVLGVIGAELFLSRSSFVLLLLGLVIYFLGWAYLRALAFPLTFLLLMIPLPTLILSQVTLPLQFLASNLASSLLAAMGVPVLREGNIIQLPTMSLEVVEACSGIRSLVSLVTLAIIYGYLLESRTAPRVFLALTAVPIAIAANSLRVTGTGLLGLYWGPDKAEGFFHTFSGWIIFLLALAMLFALHRILRFLKLSEARRS
jgi:exosortase